MGLNPVINQDNPMFEMLYRQCPSAVDGASRTFCFELCDGTMTVVAEVITDAQDIDVIGYVITEQVMKYETKAVNLIMKCQYCGSTEVIYSGIDAFRLGVEVEKTCYVCADRRAS